MLIVLLSLQFTVYSQIHSIAIWTSSCSLAYCYCSLDLLILASVSKAILHIAANAYCANLVCYHQDISNLVLSLEIAIDLAMAWFLTVPNVLVSSDRHTDIQIDRQTDRQTDTQKTTG